MEAARSTTYRLLMLLLIILIWFGLGNAAFSFAIGKVVGGAIEFAVSLALIALAVEGRVVRLLEGRRLNSLSRSRVRRSREPPVQRDIAAWGGLPAGNHHDCPGGGGVRAGQRADLGGRTPGPFEGVGDRRASMLGIRCARN